MPIYDAGFFSMTFMQIMDYVNLPPSTLSEGWKVLSQLLSHVESPSIKWDRVIFPSLTVAHSFLTNLPGTIWGSKDSEEISKLPTILCSLNTAYELPRLMDVFGRLYAEIPVEILCADTPTEIASLMDFLTDRLPELRLQRAPLISLVKPEYEMPVTKPSRRRTPPHAHFPPAVVKTINHLNIRQIPISLGKIYYNQRVFWSYYHLFAKMSEQDPETTPISDSESGELESTMPFLPLTSSKFPLPPFPMKAFDLFDEPGSIEVRFPQYISATRTEDWLNHLVEQGHRKNHAIRCLRFHGMFHGWTALEGQPVHPTDGFYYVWNDVDFAFRQRNFTFIDHYERDQATAAFFWHFKTPLEKGDERLDLIERVTHDHIISR